MWGFDDFDDFDDEDERGPTTRCKFCGSMNVEWVETAFGWKLFNDSDGSFHNCRKQKAVTADDFDDLTKE